MIRKPKCLGGWHGPKKGLCLFRVSTNCGIEAWDEYVVCKDRKALDKWMKREDMVSGMGNYSMTVHCLIGSGAFTLDSLYRL